MTDQPVIEQEVPMPIDDEIPEDERFEEVPPVEPPPREPEVEEGPKGRSVCGEGTAERG